MNENTTNTPHELGWEDKIENESSFTLLPEGDYDFIVKSYERGRFEPKDPETAKIPSCPQAIVHLEVFPQGGEGVPLDYRLQLYSSVEWKLCEFFHAIGLRKKGEPLRMNWSQVTGCTGRCKLGTREYNGKEYNEIKKLYSPDEQPYQGGANGGKPWGGGW